MDITQILSLPFHQMTQKENLTVLVNTYKEELGRKVCVSCPNSLTEMILTLKKHYNMSNFRIKNNGYYRLSKESGKTINNNIITDELAIEFLTIDPSRISVFDTYPANWEEMISGELVEDTVDTESMEQGVERELLMEMKMGELRAQYPQIKETSKEAFITAIFKLQE